MTYNQEIETIELPNGHGDIVLKRPLEISIREIEDVDGDGPWVNITCVELDTHVGGNTFAEAWKEFCDFFNEEYAHWMDSDDSGLTQDAIDLKMKYRSLVHG